MASSSCNKKNSPLLYLLLLSIFLSQITISLSSQVSDVFSLSTMPKYVFVFKHYLFVFFGDFVCCRFMWFTWEVKAMKTQMRFWVKTIKCLLPFTKEGQNSNTHFHFFFFCWRLFGFLIFFCPLFWAFFIQCWTGQSVSPL